MENLPQRKEIRLSEYDYLQNGYYFVTVCTRDKQPIFWKPVGADDPVHPETTPPPVVGADDPVRPCQDGTPPEMLSPIGKIVKQCWEEINTIYPNVRTDYYVIMPDHFHGIIVIDTPPVVGADDPVRPPTYRKANAKANCPSLPKIMQGFKSVTTRQCFQYGYRQIWQRGYYEHIIRNYDDYINTARYILNNPQKRMISDDFP